jgi:hypothetical protein
MPPPACLAAFQKRKKQKEAKRSRWKEEEVKKAWKSSKKQ